MPGAGEGGGHRNHQRVNDQGAACPRGLEPGARERGVAGPASSSLLERGGRRDGTGPQGAVGLRFFRGHGRELYALPLPD